MCSFFMSSLLFEKCTMSMFGCFSLLFQESPDLVESICSIWLSYRYLVPNHVVLFCIMVYIIISCINVVIICLYFIYCIIASGTQSLDMALSCHNF